MGLNSPDPWQLHLPLAFYTISKCTKHLILSLGFPHMPLNVQMDITARKQDQTCQRWNKLKKATALFQSSNPFECSVHPWLPSLSPRCLMCYQMYKQPPLHKNRSCERWHKEIKPQATCVVKEGKPWLTVTTDHLISFYTTV